MTRLLLGFVASALPLTMVAQPGKAVSVLVIQFHNASQYPDLNWVGESISEKLRSDFNERNEIAFGRESRNEALRRLSVRSGADYTKATLIRLGQSLDADYICYGSFDANLPSGSAALKNASLQISAHILDLRKLHDGPDLAEAGKLVDLARMEEHLAWQFLHTLDDSVNLPFEQFLTSAKLTRLDAEESYIRGLLSPNREQQVKWLRQAATLDRKFVSPAYELGKLSFQSKNLRDAVLWLQRVPPDDFRYPDARFRLGLAACALNDYGSATSYFREVAKAYPLNEVYNNLAVAESHLNQPGAADDFRKAIEGDPNDPTYRFNLGGFLLQNNRFDEAEKSFEAALSHDPDDGEARNLLGEAQRHELNQGRKGPAAQRLKGNFDATAFRQLKAVVQPRGGS